MKGNDTVLTALNKLLAEELTVISQYMVHAEMCENWGYARLHKAIEQRAVDEMHHAEWLIQRVLFLEGVPIVSALNAMHIGESVADIVANDLAAELDAVRAYNAAIRSAREAGDQATVDLLTTILKMEEGHVDWGEMQQSQIEQMGLANYLANQAETAA
jgi:bacterioferritin